MKEVAYSHDRMVELVREYSSCEEFTTKEDAIIHAQELDRKGYKTAIMKIGIGNNAGLNVFFKN